MEDRFKSKKFFFVFFLNFRANFFYVDTQVLLFKKLQEDDLLQNVNKKLIKKI